MIHVMWSCPKINQYWMKIHGYIVRVLKRHFVLCPKLYILGDYKVLSAFPQPLKSWTRTVIMIGRQIILRNWKKHGEPPLQDWLTELGKVAAYERMSYRMQDRTEKYFLKWGMYLDSISAPK